MPLLDATLSTRPAPSLWQNRTFTLFWLGQSFSFLGSGLASLVLPLLVLQATGSIAQMGVVTALIALGNLLAGMTTGGLMDRFDRRKLLLGSDGLSAVMFLSIPLVWVLTGPHMILLLVLAAPIGCLSSATAIGSAASLHRLVERDHLGAANGRLQGSLALGYIIGPLLAGPLVGLWGPVAVLTLNAASYLFSMLSLAVIRFRPAALEQISFWTRERVFAIGLRFLLRDPRLCWTVILRLGVMLALGGALDLLVFRLKDELHQPDFAVGLVWGVGSAGAIIAGSLTPLLRRRLGFGISFLGGLVIMGASLFVLGTSELLIAFILLGISFTFGDVLSQVLSATLLQELTPDELQGRVMAASQMLLWLGASAGAAASTSLAAKLGTTQPVFLGLGVFLLLLAGLGLFTPVRRQTLDRLHSGES